MPDCAQCGKELPESANFCPHCGQAVKGEGTPAPPRATPGAHLAALEDMIRDYQRALRDHPDDDDARFNLGLAYLHQGQDDLAIAELEQVRKRASDFADVHYWLAVLYHRRGDLNKAEESCLVALALEPQHRSAQRLQAKLAKEIQR